MSELKEYFKLPLSVNDTYAENELRDGNGEFILTMRGGAHKLRLIAKAVNDHDELSATLEQVTKERDELLVKVSELSAKLNQ